MSSVTAGAGKAPVLLFKTPTEPLEADPYHQTLSEDFEPYFVPVLAEEYHIDELRAVFREHERWEGVVITSRRGAEAWVQAAELEVEAKSRTRDPRTGSDGADWSTVPLWTVGAASMEVMSDYASRGPAEGRLIPAPSTSGERTAKSAATLLTQLLDVPTTFSGSTLPTQNPHDAQAAQGHSKDETTGGSQRDRRYLVIRGDKSLEEIPAALKQAGRDVVELTVYSTTPRTDIAQSHNAVLRSIDGTGAPSTTPIWLAFFSPSSASYALPHIPSALLDSGRMRVFAIGETTRAYLKERGFTVHAVAGEPNATGLLSAILAAGK